MTFNAKDPSKFRTGKQYNTKVIPQRVSHKWSQSITDVATSQGDYDLVNTRFRYEGRISYTSCCTCCTCCRCCCSRSCRSRCGRRRPHHTAHVVGNHGDHFLALPGSMAPSSLPLPPSIDGDEGCRSRNPLSEQRWRRQRGGATSCDADGPDGQNSASGPRGCGR